MVRATGRHAEAGAIAAEALAGLRRSVGPDHPFTLACADGYVADLRAGGDGSDARRLAADTVARSRTVRGAAHPDTLICAWNATRDGDPDPTATPEAALGDLAKALGDGHPAVLAATAGGRLVCDIEPPPL